MQEYIIPNLSNDEIDLLERYGESNGIDWCPYDLMTTDVCIYGSQKDVDNALHIIGRK